MDSPRMCRSTAARNWGQLSCHGPKLARCTAHGTRPRSMSARGRGRAAPPSFAARDTYSTSSTQLSFLHSPRPPPSLLRRAFELGAGRSRPPAHDSALDPQSQSHQLTCSLSIPCTLESISTRGLRTTYSMNGPVWIWRSTKRRLSALGSDRSTNLKPVSVSYKCRRYCAVLKDVNCSSLGSAVSKFQVESRGVGRAPSLRRILARRRKHFPLFSSTTAHPNDLRHHTSTPRQLTCPTAS